MTTDRPIERWQSLRHSGIGDGLLEVPSLSSGIETGFGPVRFAVGPSGQPRLLVPCGPRGALSTEMKGNLSVTISRFSLGGRTTLFIDLMSNEGSLDPVFAELASEILHRIGAGEGPGPAIEGTIADFRDLLREPNAEDVTDGKIIGLVGELVVLLDLVRDGPRAVDAWVGPFEERHDFRRREHALEVKTSSRADSSTVTISSCEQLSQPDGGTIFLVHVRIERSATGDLSVSRLVERLLEAGASRTTLEKGLAALGCTDAAASLWNRLRFNLEGVSSYRVEDGFPRITASAFKGERLPDGIDSITYTIDLRAAQPFLMTDAERRVAFARIAS